MHLDLAARMHRFAQQLQAALRSGVRREHHGIQRHTLGRRTRGRRQHRENLAPGGSASPAMAGSSQACASRTEAASALASACVNISGGKSKPAPSR
jgi:hypothetical protein